MPTDKAESKSAFIRILDKLYGGLNMSWFHVTVFALITAAVTAVILILPAFKGTSFERISTYPEAWVFFAVIIVTNCQKPLESALKTFVFFLICLPLVCLLQVPFSTLGWVIFFYYKYWFVWTLLTFPLAYIGWYVTRKNWLSLLILVPVLLELTFVYLSFLTVTMAEFPNQLGAAVFCLAQVLLYLYIFTPKLPQRLIGLLAPLAAVAIFFMIVPPVDIIVVDYLPGNPVFTEQASVSIDDAELADVSFFGTGENSRICVHGKKYGSSVITVTDGERVFRYTLEVYYEKNSPNIRFIPIKQTNTDD